MSDSMTTSTVRLTGHGGDEIEAYLARPSEAGSRGGVVVIHHMPGYDRATKEITRRIAELGYDAIMPNLYWREAPGAHPTSNGRVGVIGYCSGGRQSVLAACHLDLDAAVDCYGAFVTGTPPEGGGRTNLVSVLPDLRAPTLGLFGAQDRYPSPEHVAELREILAAHGKEFEEHTYEDAGHAFFAVDRPAYRVAAANDGWERIAAFYAKHLG
jgi:carboxymethylenebutenolidase